MDGASQYRPTYTYQCNLSQVPPLLGLPAPANNKIDINMSACPRVKERLMTIYRFDATYNCGVPNLD